MGSLKVVCLISGGKDSLFSILHCLKNGHKVVALANLHPPYDENQRAAEDMDSYMYQTIGHAVIPLYETALALPLYRQSISGLAVNQDKCYSPVNGNDVEAEDETEALLPLLRNVQAHHPEVSAVNTGAILSDYQRTRVESAAIRLGLTPLSYLWQWPALPPHSQTSLLEDMAAVGQDSRIVKVASGGLDDSFLWQNVAEPRIVRRLASAAQRFGSSDDGAVLGEGGEYETLAVTGPAPLWKAHILIGKDRRNIIAGEAGSASIQVLGAYTQAKSDVSGDLSKLRTPPLLEARFQIMLDNISYDGPGSRPRQRTKDSTLATTSSISTDDSPYQIFLPDLTGDGVTPTEQMQSIMRRMRESLWASNHSFSDVVYTTIILQDMDDFAAINAVYGTYFPRPNPPARVTIACADILPEGKHLVVSMTSVKLPDLSARRGLHVQSRSYWAPANIGPYSQAISVPLTSDADLEARDLVYVAGQIPLVPASMDLPLPTGKSGLNDFALQAILALQHFERIGRVMHVRQWVCGIAFITATSSEEASMRSNIAHGTWEALHRPGIPIGEQDDEDGSFDVWDVRFGNDRKIYQQHVARDSAPPEEYRIREIPLLYVVLVDALPKQASIEWVTYGLTKAGKPDPELHHFQHLLTTFEVRIV